jgi:(4S)-4-hydroxy-5-phosphonooxypentane-2,3-dione isomerase
MYVVCVTIHVKPEHVDAFIAATLENARNSRHEPGNLRYDVLRAEDDPQRFFLYEVYHSKEDFAAHQQTPHYFTWRDAVQDWMAQPRQGVRNLPLFFGDEVAERGQ